MRMLIGGPAGWPMNWPDTGTTIRRDRGGVECRILDVVTHRGDVVVTEWLDVHQCTTVIEHERTVVVVVDFVAEIHELRWRTDVELKTLEHVGDAVAVDAERLTHPMRVHRTRGHPFLDRDLRHRLPPESADEMRHSAAVDQLSRQQ